MTSPTEPGTWAHDVPAPYHWARDQIRRYEASGGSEANTLLDTGIPIVVVTTKGANSGKTRKTALMRDEHHHAYALDASLGGSDHNPQWYYNLMAHPDAMQLQDGPQAHPVAIHEATGSEREEWWRRAIAVFPTYERYQNKTEREFPIVLASLPESERQ